MAERLINTMIRASYRSAAGFSGGTTGGRIKDALRSYGFGALVDIRLLHIQLLNWT
jgi:hypothetical protein